MATCIGEKIEDFKVGNLLGKGSFAGVYRAVSLKTGLEVAIKMIDKKAMHKVGMVQRVQNEVKIHCQLKHPSILELYNYFEDGNYVYLILEMCHNGEMSRYIKNRKKPFSEDEVDKGFQLEHKTTESLTTIVKMNKKNPSKASCNV